jgi:Collagen triple helix repeat (20 copies)
MLRRLHDRLGTAGLIIAVIALVAALAGSALAASGALTGKQKKEVKKIAKQFAGKDGAPGAAGQPGAQGPKGDSGAPGANGKDGATGAAGATGPAGATGLAGSTGATGADGEDVSIIPLPEGNEKCVKGGTKFVNGTGEGFACNGKDGTGGGSVDTMRGYWEVLGDAAVHEAGGALTTISFPAPLSTAPGEVILIPSSGGTVEQVEKCPGNSESPKATAGVLCLYQFIGAPVTLNFGLATTFGAGLFFGENDEGVGAWAVKVPSS